jgi:murein DD-endopeptidase MepM/ murein hydrolase activator NlpD
LNSLFRAFRILFSDTGILKLATMTKQPIIIAVLIANFIVGCSGVSDNFSRQLISSATASRVDLPQVLDIPTSGIADVAPGDTIYAIARRYGVAMRDVIDANNLEAPFVLKIGQSLRLPPPRLYAVSPGDTIFSISQRFGVDMRTLVSMNSLAAPYQVTAGQELKMPVRGAAEPAVGVSASDDNRFDNVVAIPLPAPRPSTTETVGERAASQRASIQPPKRGGKRFLWPVRGRIISNFGPRAGGLHNDGINIAAPKGMAILAAENGVVAYAGKELRSFGNLLLIKHAGGWTTAYAHADKLLVRRGDRVKRGQTIATIGSSGGVGRPQLHFELRQGSRALDPRRELEI